MHVRDAIDEDADGVAGLADLPRPAAERLLRERRVRVATDEDGANGASGGERDGDVVGFVAYDTDGDAIHVTRLAGEASTFEDLLAEPRSFATNEGIALEVVVPESDEEMRRAVETMGFEARGSGPRFDGEETRKYRWEAED